MVLRKLSHLSPPMSSTRKAKLAIIHWIHEKNIKVGDRLPPQTALVEALSCSESTIQAAMRELAQEGIVSRTVGKGTFLLRLPEDLEFVKGTDGTTDSPTKSQPPFLGNIALGTVDIANVQHPDYSPSVEILQSAENILYLYAQEVKTFIGIWTSLEDVKNFFNKRRFNGVLVNWRISPQHPVSLEIRRFLMDLAIPVVHCTHEVSLWNGFSYLVSIDNREIMRIGIHYLYHQLAHRNILVVGTGEPLSFQEHRFQACQEMKQLYPEIRLHLHTIPKDKARGWFESGAAAYHFWASMNPRPTAVFTINDEMAAGFWTEANQHQVQIPQDVSLLGIDNSIRIRALYQIELSSVDPKRNLVGETAGMKLIELLRENVYPGTYGSIWMVRPQLISRSSTAVLAD